MQHNISKPKAQKLPDITQMRALFPRIPQIKGKQKQNKKFKKKLYFCQNFTHYKNKNTTTLPKFKFFQQKLPIKQQH